MKVLLDENLPHELRQLFLPYQAFTIAYMKWGGLKNGTLRQHAANENLDAFISMDKGVQYQQNLAALPCAVIILRARSNDLDEIRPLIGALLVDLENAPLKRLTIVQ